MVHLLHVPQLDGSFVDLMALNQNYCAVYQQFLLVFFQQFFPNLFSGNAIFFYVCLSEEQHSTQLSSTQVSSTQLTFPHLNYSSSLFTAPLTVQIRRCHNSVFQALIKKKKILTLFASLSRGRTVMIK